MPKATERNRFSTYVKRKDSPDYRILEEWCAWFNRRGIPAQIKCVQNGYALFREGLVDVPKEPTAPIRRLDDANFDTGRQSTDNIG